MTDRVIVLIDMDCFYCQVETRLNPALKGLPMAVVQYNQCKGGGIIAVNYEARDRGVTRHMRGKEAKEHCPDIVLVTVPTVRDKADLTRYRDAGREVLSVFCQFSNCVQRASIDEAFIDLTSLVDERMKTQSHFDPSKWKSTFVVGYSTDGCNDEEQRHSGLSSWLEDCESMHNTPSLRLAVGALIVEEMREAVFQETGFRCSAGIAHNKILAKLACGLHKPNRQTVLPHESVEILYQTLPVKKIRNLGGKFGDEVVEKLGCKTMSDLAKFTEKDLQDRYDEKNGSWLYNIARGYDFEPVSARLVSKSIGCCKKFPGRTALKTSKDVYHWLNKLSEELSERLFEDETMNKRKAQLLTVSMGLEINKIDTASSKSVSLTSYNIDKIFGQAEALLRKSCKIDPITDVWSPPIKFLGLSAGKFSDITNNKIDKFFKVGEAPSMKNVVSESDNKLDKNRVTEEKDNETLTSNESSKPSFFEKILAKDIHGSGKKLKIVPDFTRNDLISDSDDSQSSLIKLRNASIETEQPVTFRDCIKKNLFDSSLNNPSHQTNSVENHLQSNSTIQHKELIGVNPKNVNQSQEKTKRKSSESNKSIASFFEQTPKNVSWTKPEELFPDLSQIDESILSLLPSSYRDKILKLKNENKEIVDISGGESLGENNENISNLGECSEMDSQTCDNQNIQGEVCSNIVDSMIKNDSSDNLESDKRFKKNSSVEYNVSPTTHPIDSTSGDANLFCTNAINNEIPFTSDYFTPSEYLVTCEECGEKVQNYDLHKDMHFAKKLHKELNSNSQIAPVILSSKEKNLKEKRKKSTNSKSSLSNAKKVRKIDAYFKT